MTMLLVGFYGLYLSATAGDWRGRRTALFSAVGMVFLAVVLSAVQWIPSKELIDRSPRAGGLSYEEATYGSWHPQLLPALLVREAYGTRARDTDWMDGFFPYHEMNTYMSLLGLALAVVGTAAYRVRWVGFWILLAGAALVLMMGRYTVFYDLWYRVPILGSGRIPVRYHLWLATAVAALAAVGVDRLARGPVVRLRWGALAVGTLLAVAVPVLVWTYTPVWTDSQRWTLPYHLDRYNWLGAELTVATIRTLGLALLGWGLARQAVRSADPGRRQRLAAILPLLVLADLISAHAQDAPTVSPRYWTDPPESVAFLRSSPELQRIFGISSMSAAEPGYASTNIDPMPARDSLSWSLAPVWGMSSSGGLTPIISKRIERYDTAASEGGSRFDLEGVSHILTGTPSAGDRKRFENPQRVGRAYIIENRSALPRVRFASRPVYADDERDAAVQLNRLRREALERLVVEDPTRPLPEDSPLPEWATAQLLLDEPEHLVVEASTSSPAYLVVADTFDPGWSATVSGKPVPIRPANVAFRAVLVPGGRHTVVFRYTPAGFREGAWVSGLGLLMVFLCVGWPGPREPTLELHGLSPWTRYWPWILLVGLVLLIGGSAIKLDPGNLVTLQSRWQKTGRQFTWGAGIEAMRPA